MKKAINYFLDLSFKIRHDRSTQTDLLALIFILIAWAWLFYTVIFSMQ